MTRASAHHLHCIACGRIYVIVHSDYHRNEDDGVVEQMKLDAREPDLSNARRHLSAEPEVMSVGLVEQDEMLEVVPDLNPERNHPPLVRSTGESATQHPKTDQHHQCEAVVKRFSLHQPG